MLMEAPTSFSEDHITLYDLKGAKIPHMLYLVLVLLEEGMIRAFSSAFNFSKVFFSFSLASPQPFLYKAEI